MRVPSRHGQGQPEFKKVHPRRQRRAMRRLLCQVCDGPADQGKDGVLWLLADDQDQWEGWPEQLPAAEPPICLACARLAVRVCPALRKGAVAVRVRRYPVVGVHGLLHTAIFGDPVPVGPKDLAYSDPAVKWLQASHLLRELRGCKIVELDELS
jgi:hypothetical protein